METPLLVHAPFQKHVGLRLTQQEIRQLVVATDLCGDGTCDCRELSARVRECTARRSAAVGAAAAAAAGAAAVTEAIADRAAPRPTMASEWAGELERVCSAVSSGAAHVALALQILYPVAHRQPPSSRMLLSAVESPHHVPQAGGEAPPPPPRGHLTLSVAVDLIKAELGLEG
jgi:hypothetical protein